MSRENKFPGANGDSEILISLLIYTLIPIVGVGKERRILIGPW